MNFQDRQNLSFTVKFHVNECPGLAKPIKTVLASGRGDGHWLGKGLQELSGVMIAISILIAIWITQECASVET